MSDTCPTGFDQALVSAHLDGELSQGEAQRVRLHLEDCAACRALYDQLSTLRSATMTTPFATPLDDQWDERPRSLGARLTRAIGWLLIAAGALALVALLWGLPEEPGPWLERVLLVGVWGGLAFLLVSVLIDRLRDLRRDRYRGVRK